MLTCLAQVMIGGGGFIQMAIFAVIIISVLAIIYVVLQQSGIPIPAWIWTILWILLLAVVAIFAIRFLASL